MKHLILEVYKKLIWHSHRLNNEFECFQLKLISYFQVYTNRDYIMIRNEWVLKSTFYLYFPIQCFL